jgi:hypothetical protein
LWALRFWALSALSWPEDRPFHSALNRRVRSFESVAVLTRGGHLTGPSLVPMERSAIASMILRALIGLLYASSQRLGCFLETLARFRVDLTLYAELSEIEGEDDFTPLGHVPLAWARPRMLGSAEHGGKYADLYGSDWIGLLRRDLAADCLVLGIGELDASVLQGSTARALTQRAARLVFRNAFDGIYYRSGIGIVMPPLSKPLPIIVLCPSASLIKGSSACTLPETLPKFRPFPMIAFRSRIAWMSSRARLGCASGLPNRSIRTVSPSMMRAPSGTVWIPMPPPEAIRAEPPPTPNFTAANGITVVSPARIGSATRLPVFSSATSLSKSASGLARGVCALPTTAGMAIRNVSAMSLLIVVAESHLFLGRGHAQKLDSFLSERHEADGPCFAAHQEAVAAGERARGRLSGRVRRNRDAASAEVEIDHRDADHGIRKVGGNDAWADSS